jgi:lipoprotein-releasing system ATP-binding protein
LFQPVTAAHRILETVALKPVTQFMSASPLLELRNVSKTYASPDGAPPVPVLRDASLSVAAGESVAIVGPSGCGKSTILNLIGTLDRPDAGQLQLAGRDLTRLDERELATVRNTSLGFVFQSHHLLPHCSALENVLVPLLARSSRPDAAMEQRATQLLERVGLGSRRDALPGRLSGGERQRVALVRALVHRPLLLLADEPTGALDRASAEGVASLLLELNREEGVTLLVVTHSPELARRLQRVVTVTDGRLVAA